MKLAAVLSARFQQRARGGWQKIDACRQRAASTRFQHGNRLHRQAALIEKKIQHSTFVRQVPTSDLGITGRRQFIFAHREEIYLSK